MQRVRARLARLGPVECFDYRYQLAGRKTPDRMPELLGAHRAALEALAKQHEGPIVLVGKSMGGRIGCHLACEPGAERVAALVCLGYPLVGQNGAVRDQVLLELAKPILFVQGSRDAMCPLDQLAGVEARMRAPHERFVIDGGDHSLQVRKGDLSSSNRTQEQVDESILERVRQFLEGVI
jgi:predicted alpha/beta-hydrolase family hydrolase